MSRLKPLQVRTSNYTHSPYYCK